MLGEAGIGKSRLVGEFVRHADEQRLRVLLGEPSPGVSGAAGQTRLFELVLGVLSRLGQERPIVPVIEDVHWADDASPDLLTFLIRNQRSERLATVLTFRTDELSNEHPVRGRINELERSGRAQRIELAPLSAEHVAVQVHDITGAPPTSEFARALYSRAQGNPFFTEELLAAGDGDALPPSLRDALLIRLRRRDRAPPHRNWDRARGGHAGPRTVAVREPQ